MNKKKLFIIVVLICLIILIVLLILLKRNLQPKDGEHELKLEQQEGVAEMAEEYFSDKICPQGMSSLYSEYYGVNDMNDLYRSLYKLVNYIEKIYSEISTLDDAQLQEFYNKNWRNIRINFGINTADEFMEFVKYLKNIGFDNEKYESCKIDKNSYQVEGDYLTFNISFSYENRESLINLKTYFAIKSNTEPEIKYTPVN